MISFHVDDSDFIRVMTGSAKVVGSFIDTVAEDVSKAVQSEVGGVSSSLSQPWVVEDIGGEQRNVKSPEFWWHFLAHGTAGHGPRSAGKLMFSVNGQMVFANFVSGIPANPFDERAIQKTQSRVLQLLMGALPDGAA